MRSLAAEVRWTIYMTRKDVQEFVATLPEPSVTTNVDGHFKVANDAFRRLLRETGRPRARRLHDIVVEELSEVDTFLASMVRARPASRRRLALASDGDARRTACFGGVLPGGDGVYRPLILLRFCRPDGSVEPLPQRSGNVDELHAEIRRRRSAEQDVRELQECLEQRVEQRTAELERANRELLRSNESLEEFAYVAAHDLRDPLRKITLFSEMLRGEVDEGLSKPDQDVLLRMADVAARMDALIENLLEYARVSTSATPLGHVDLNGILKQVLGDLEVDISETKAVIDVETLPAVSADAMQMCRLFQNLISNGLKFRRRDVIPHIRISASMRKEASGTTSHVVEVSDNGIGFDQAFAEAIFDPFRRLNTRDAIEGTGIGLALCRRIVERHGGSISAVGEPGRGATFRLTLPAS